MMHTARSLTTITDSRGPLTRSRATLKGAVR